MCYWGEKYLSHEAPNSKYSTQDSQLMRWFLFKWNIHWKIMFRFAFACYATTISQWLTESRIVHRLKMFEQQFYCSSDFPNREKKSHFFQMQMETLCEHCSRTIPKPLSMWANRVLAVKDLDLVSSNIYCGLFPISARKNQIAFWLHVDFGNFFEWANWKAMMFWLWFFPFRAWREKVVTKYYLVCLFSLSNLCLLCMDCCREII